MSNQSLCKEYVFGQWKNTFIHAVIPIRMVAKLFYGLTADQAGIGGLSSQRKCCTVQVLTVTLLTILQTLSQKSHTKWFRKQHYMDIKTLI